MSCSNPLEEGLELGKAFVCQICGMPGGRHSKSCPFGKPNTILGYPVVEADFAKAEAKLAEYLIRDGDVGKRVSFVGHDGRRGHGVISAVDGHLKTCLIQVDGQAGDIILPWDDPSLDIKVEPEPGRMPRQTYFMKIAGLVSQRSTCLSRQAGAVIVLDNHILSTGYNGAPAGQDHCLEVGCARQEWRGTGTRLDLCRAAHAEINAICFAARHGVAIAGATLYTTTFPCGECAKAIINAGIIKVVYHQEYFDERGYEILRSIEVELFRPERKLR